VVINVFGAAGGRIILFELRGVAAGEEAPVTGRFHTADPGAQTDVVSETALSHTN